MGYTHYWRQHSTPSKASWNKFMVAANLVLETAGIRISREYLVKYGDSIWLNGVGDDSHETFVLTRNMGESPSWDSDKPGMFSFCKTARKPYDIVVVSILRLAEVMLDGAFLVTSDGEDDELAEGRALAIKVLTS